MSLSVTKGLCNFAFVSISVSSKVRWRSSLCFITKPQQSDVQLHVRQPSTYAACAVLGS